jgi:predicted AAA+ superfamily ATPase
MNKFKRTIEKQIESYLSSDSNKIFFIWGPRRSGKTTVLTELSERLSVRLFNFDVISDRELFIPTREALSKIASSYKVILIDEVQNYPEGTIALKILHDEFKVKIIATGSSELRQKTKDFDTLAGRSVEYYCLPLSVYEIFENSRVKSIEENSFIKQMQNDLQIFGSYPEVYLSTNLSESERIDLLQDIFDKYVLKDVIDIYDLKNEKLAKDILTKIALQIGSEVSVREIANDLKATVSTVSNYIEIFIKNYILIPLPSFKTNLRRAVSENRKFFFYDLGIRNVLVRDFRELDLRPDKGGVFENFIVSEIEKQKRNLKAKQSIYFYREYGGLEVDLVLEDYKKQYKTLEIKSNNEKSKDIFPIKHEFDVINSSNYFEVIKNSIK